MRSEGATNGGAAKVPGLVLVSVTDTAGNPVSPGLAQVTVYAGIAPDDDKTRRPWRVRHPLQPFDGRYFNDTDPALFSYINDCAQGPVRTVIGDARLTLGDEPTVHGGNGTVRGSGPQRARSPRVGTVHRPSPWTPHRWSNAFAARIPVVAARSISATG